jgi:hypothetical protein
MYSINNTDCSSNKEFFTKLVEKNDLVVSSYLQSTQLTFNIICYFYMCLDYIQSISSYLANSEK